MMDIMDLASQLPNSTKVPLVVDDQRGVLRELSIPNGFVSRGITFDTNQADCPILLIVAPAAVGKSTCARAMAAQADCLFVDLVGRQVGDGSFSGMLLEALGPTEVPKVLDALQNDRMSIIIDSLDETFLKSGDHNFLAYVQGICRFARTSHGNGNILLFSRLDAADWIEETCKEEGVAIRRATICYFNQEQSEQVMALNLDQLYDKKRAGRAHRVGCSNYVNARNLLIGRVASALGVDGPDYWSTSSGIRFFGYAPVLEALSSALCVQNHDKLVHQINSEEPISGNGTVREWAALRGLCESLLVREQKKFVDNFWSAELQGKHPDIHAKLLYSHDEQCLRLLSRIELREERVDLPAHLPPNLRTDYQQKVKEQLGSHPFLSSEQEFVNSVFRDYVYSLAMVGVDTGDRAAGSVIGKLRANRGLPSPVLGPMMVEMLNSRDSSTLDSNKCDLLVESLQAQEDKGLKYSFHANGDATSGVLEIIRSRPGDRIHDNGFAVQLYPSRDGLRIPARCRNFDVDYGGDAKLGDSSQALRIGPGVTIRCSSLEVEGVECVVDATDEDNPVTIETDLLTSAYSLDIRIFGRAFKVLCNEVDGPLGGYASQKTEQPLEFDIDKFNALRRFLGYFRRTVHDGPRELSAPKDAVDRLFVRSNPLAQEVIGALSAKQVLRISDDRYAIDQSSLTKIGVNYADVRNSVIGDSLREFIAEW